MKHDAEGEIRQAFQQTLTVRKLGPDAMNLADRHFFETIVPLHLQGEGAAFTGLKPAGRDLGPAILAADKALETGSADALARLLAGTVEYGLRERFADAMAKKSFQPDEVAKGQEFVEAYVGFVHYVEQVYEFATLKVHGHALRALIQRLGVNNPKARSRGPLQLLFILQARQFGGRVNLRRTAPLRDPRILVAQSTSSARLP